MHITPPAVYQFFFHTSKNNSDTTSLLDSYSHDKTKIHPTHLRSLIMTFSMQSPVAVLKHAQPLVPVKLMGCTGRGGHRYDVAFRAPSARLLWLH